MCQTHQCFFHKLLVSLAVSPENKTKKRQIQTLFFFSGNLRSFMSQKCVTRSSAIDWELMSSEWLAS